MTEEPEKPLLDTKLNARPLPEEVKRNRELFQKENEELERVAQPRMEAQLHACRMVAQQLERWHTQLAEETDLDPTAYSRGSAIWLLAGRSLGYLEALIVLAQAGIETETLVMGRALHEADQILLAFCGTEHDELVRVWLDDEGRHNYVRQKAASEAQRMFEEKLDAHMAALGLPTIGRTEPLVNDLYDRMSRVAHNRRSACLAGLSEPLRQYAYGRHESVIRRAILVEWVCSMAGEVLNAVGDALRAFYGQGFFVEHVTPLVKSVEAVRETCPLDEDSLREAAFGSG